MVTKLKASLDANGAISDWNFEVWSNTHSMRPGGAGSMLAAQHMAQPFSVPEPKPIPLPFNINVKGAFFLVGCIFCLR